MRSIAVVRVLLAAALASGAFLETAHAAPPTRVDLMIDEGGHARGLAWPVTTGVPFPQGALTRAEQCRLLDDTGAEQPLQARVVATWDAALPEVGQLRLQDAAGASIRWLTIDFIAHPGRKYALEFGPEVVRRAFPTTLTVRAGDTTTIETGPLRAEFAKHGPAALRGVSIDLNADGRIDDGERIAAGASDGDHVLVDQSGESWTSAGDGDERQIVVESAGPVRSCIRVDGWYTARDGRRIVRYRTRYHLFAGLPLVKLIDEFRIVGSTRDVQFRDIALPLELKLDRASRRIATGWGEERESSIELPWNSETQSVSLAQETYRHYGNPDCRAAIIERTAAGEQVHRQGERAGAWLQAADDRAAVTGSLRSFWQQFPKEWELTGNELNGDRLTLHLWSPRGGTLDFGEAGLRAFFGPAGHKYLLDWGGVGKPGSPIEHFFYFAGRHALERDGADGLGLNKHHEAWFHFSPAADAAAGREYAALADRQPLCLASGAWNCATGVFGPLAARPNDSPHEAIVDRVFELERYAQDAFGDYGWWLFGAGPHYSYQWDAETGRHYADPRRFEYHTYQRETQLWWCYLRSGERKFWEWALPAEDHWVDVAVSHVPTKYSTQWRGGAPGEATLTFPAGDWSIDSPLHYVRHHDTGEAWLRGAAQFWGTYHRTLETTTLAYYLTGDERYNDVIGFWRDYWAPLASVRSDAGEVPAWHREQTWFRPTAPGEPTKSWAEMLRDYAPFQSGSRHQMTLFFNLATLYEHTWDPAIQQVLREFADAYLDPDSPNGVWQCQDHRLPANSDCPMLAHYWSPALWKYARATGDPRMPNVLRKYFTACGEADPYAEEVGVYSNSQIAWAWHFTRDPAHLRAARWQLDEMLSAAAPLAKPEDLGPRIYNPYDPIRTLAAVPRLIGALADAEEHGIEVPATTVAPQRALIALHRQPGQPLRAVTWGWDQEPAWLDSTGEPAGPIVESAVQRSHRQPFDRNLPGHQVFRNVVELPDDGGAWCFLSPKLETGLLELSGADSVWCWAGEPLWLAPRETLWWPRGASGSELIIETAQAGQLRVTRDGQPLAGTLTGGAVAGNLLTVPLGDVSTDAWLGISPVGNGGAWFRLAGVPETERWVSTTPGPARDMPPSDLITRRARPQVDPDQTFVPGRFGQGLLIVPGRELHVPDEVTAADGTSRRLSDQRQGTIEFWVRRLADDRLAPLPIFPFLDNGPLQAWCPWKLPLDEWAHVAVVWRPLPADPQRMLVHIYVDGRDYATYRNLFWEGYAGPPGLNTGGDWLKKFVVRAPPGVSYIIDDIRISNTPRYCDPALNFGPQQTYNPVTFPPPAEPAGQDEATVIWLPLDGDVNGAAIDNARLEAMLIGEQP